ncbi:MAG: GTPase HflX [Phycisphaerales bacterium]|nr:GTPase HflX [Planctomycetota bacterium]
MPAPKERSGIQVQSERAVLAAVRLPESNFDKSDPFGELRSLAEQGGAVVVAECTQNLPKPIAGTYMGSGKLAELKGLCEEVRASTVIFDHDLSPKQIAKIEEAVGRKVIDRSELILDIFASRATSAEAQLQVELAQLEYTFPRLRAMWSHLERIVGVGGIGGIGTRGPGEQQLEIDRRLVQRRRDDLTRQIREIQGRRRREVQARKAEHFTVGIVGYTNAGKSTLFNTLTAGGAYADNRLFATLMTRTREWTLRGEEGNVGVMLSDTVGFVRDLPTNLIAAFRATLEEATHADVLLIVLDISDPAAELQYQTVCKTLDDLLKEVREHLDDEESWTPPRRILLLNKADKLPDNRELLIWQQRVPDSIPICALAPEKGEDIFSRQGHRELVTRIREFAQGDVQQVVVTVPMREGKLVTVLENQSKVLDRSYVDDSVRLKLQIGRTQLERLLVGRPPMTITDARGKPWKPKAPNLVEKQPDWTARAGAAAKPKTTPAPKKPAETATKPSGSGAAKVGKVEKRA